MKNILIISAIAIIGFTSCKNEKKESTESKVIEVVEKVDNTEKTNELFEEFKSLYDELLSFKGKSDFKKFGFGKGGKYNKWLSNVEDLKNNPDSKLLLQKGVLAGELELLGFAYVGSKGKETEVSKSFNKVFSEAISSKPVEKVETASGNSNYDKLKSEYKLFGKWKITNTTVKSSYPYEIYKKGTEFIGVIPKDEYKTENIIKKGNKYSVKGNKYGEYYIINSSKEMTLFDKGGELKSMGYIATKE